MQGVVSISASPGIRSQAQRQARAEADAEAAQQLQEIGLEAFVDAWYSKPMWHSLRQHPRWVYCIQAGQSAVQVLVQSIGWLACRIALVWEAIVCTTWADSIPCLVNACCIDNVRVGSVQHWCLCLAQASSWSQHAETCSAQTWWQLSVCEMAACNEHNTCRHD